MKPFFTALIAFFIVGMHSALACEGCRQPGVLSEPQTALAGVGFSWSVLVMLCLVFSLLGGMTWYITNTCKRIDRGRDRHGE
ncbi:MAG: hypothetical protein ABI615_04200 [Chthoniobacterales bacterium]